MTILHKGMRRMTTDVLDDYGQAHYLQNVRLKRVGEVGRRAGLGKSTMAQLAGPVQFMIGAWSNVPYIINGTSGSVTGEEDPLALWTAATMRIPDGLAGEPAAPVIDSIVYSPTSPQPYTAGTVTMTATVTYDGLSGALSYSWSWTIGPATPTPVAPAVNPGVFDFGGFCIPGVYGGTLTVTPADAPAFATNHALAFTVT